MIYITGRKTLFTIYYIYSLQK